MKALFFACHMCGSYESEVLTPAFLADGSFCEFQKIVMCGKCGLVYKNPVIPELNKLVYSKGSWQDGSVFQERIIALKEFLAPFVEKKSPRIIVEVGPGPGWLSKSLKEMLPNTRFILLEASEEVAKLAKTNIPEATIIPSAIDEVSLKGEFADLVLVCGVDYLFSDFLESFRKIHDSIVEDGYLYIERNVFVEAESYAWYPIKSYRNLFGQNVLMTTWFAVDQYKCFLETFFDVISERSFLLTETDGHKCMIYGYLCKKKSISKVLYDGKKSWYEKNKASLLRLSKNDQTISTHEDQGLYTRMKKLLTK